MKFKNYERYDSYKHNLEYLHNKQFIAVIGDREKLIDGVILSDTVNKYFYLCQNDIEGANDFFNTSDYDYAWGVYQPQYPDYDQVHELYIKIKPNNIIKLNRYLRER